MDVAFLAYLGVIAEEYVGVGYHYVPILKKLSVALLVMAVLLLYVVKRHGLRAVLANRPAGLLLILICLTSLGLAFGLVRRNAIDPLKQQIAYFALLVVGFYLLDSMRKVAAFAVAFVVLHALLVLRNLDKLSEVERKGDFVAGYFLGNGNDFAWSMCVTFPFALFLFLRAETKLAKLAALGLCGLLVIGVVGTQSRGATIALVALLLYGWAIMSTRKLLGLVGIATLLGLVVVLAPAEYFDRMNTISSYEEDSSAVSRLHAWKRATEMAIDNPLLGVGAGSFNSAYGRFYRNMDEGDSAKWISPHSVYFRVLGEYGFLGLGLILYLLVSIFRENQRTKALVRAHDGAMSVPANWPDILNMSLIGYAVAGIFLGGVNYPHVYLIAMLTMTAKRLALADTSERPHEDAVPVQYPFAPEGTMSGAQSPGASLAPAEKLKGRGQAQW